MNRARYVGNVSIKVLKFCGYPTSEGLKRELVIKLLWSFTYPLLSKI